MNDTAHEPRYKLLSLSMTSSYASVLAALKLLQKVSIECEALLVTAPDEESGVLGEGGLTWGRAREAVIKEGADVTGMTAKTISTSFEDSLSHFQGSSAEDVFIVLQPAHPLERQSPSFIRLNEEIHKSPSLVIYVPDEPHKLSEHILFIGRKVSESVSLRAQSFSDQSCLTLNHMDYPGSLAEVQNFLLAKPHSQRPTLLIIASDITENSASAWFKFAALTGVPVGVIPNCNNEDGLGLQ